MVAADPLRHPPRDHGKLPVGPPASLRRRRPHSAHLRGCGTDRPTGYTPRYLRALFAEHMGHSPKELAAIVRMQCALRYLEEENGSVNLSEAAARFGFSDQSHMNCEFRRFLGATFGAVKGAPSWIDEIVSEATRQV